MPRAEQFRIGVELQHVSAPAEFWSEVLHQVVASSWVVVKVARRSAAEKTCSPRNPWFVTAPHQALMRMLVNGEPALYSEITNACKCAEN